MDKMSSAHVYIRLRKVFGVGIQESRVAFRKTEREIAGRRVGLHLKIAVRERNSREESRVAFENRSEREKKQGGE